MSTAVSHITSTQTSDPHNFVHWGALIHFPGFLTAAMEKVSCELQITAALNVQGPGKLLCISKFAEFRSSALLKHRPQDMRFSHSLLIFNSIENKCFSMQPSRKSGVLTLRHLKI